jgi:hypothetical protein
MGPPITPPNIAAVDGVEERRGTREVGKLLNKFALLVRVERFQTQIALTP